MWWEERERSKQFKTPNSFQGNCEKVGKRRMREKKRRKRRYLVREALGRSLGDREESPLRSRLGTPDVYPRQKDVQGRDLATEKI